MVCHVHPNPGYRSKWRISLRRFCTGQSGKLLQIVKVKSEKTVKKFKAKNTHVRKWTSNTKGFCWVDTEGRFWRWSYDAGEDPEQLFKLISTAPKYWMTPVAAHDGSWYAVVATEKDRRSGVVHAFPENHGESRIFHGPAAAAFTRVTSNGITETVIVMMSLTQEGKNGCVSSIHRPIAIGLFQT